MARSDRLPQDCPLELAQATSLPCWKLLDRGDISREESIALLPAPFNKEDYRRFVEGCLPYFTPLPAGVDILNRVRAKGYRTYVLSNFHKEYFDGVYKCYKDEEVCFAKFDGMTISSHVHCIKPQPEIYQHLLQDHQLLAEETLFIDDSEENVAAAQAMGIDALLCKDHAALLQEMQRLGAL
ncbi:HAD hydrolase, family IA, variant 3 subfamily protein [Acanthamoeba castellanii str. Neff]|uniref:HAD hydrolase, family IA, variant 3 subfamily protein n=1 Tax=Acanthamoeba castellanii (strain ATCC 30010 / Neff) TaxID=1257118 RepID=L8H744_ACACF|nr:HAD hydrolase, family IA, variant 3 subfamily protein [Acanthamoeba castellanii str. Neff]ELR21042.1 HAD hydrolase, family IA, variant 3 subfamily protein [Acanthamoeba castellanii str. Neff]